MRPQGLVSVGALAEATSASFLKTGRLSSVAVTFVAVEALAAVLFFDSLVVSFEALVF